MDYRELFKESNKEVEERFLLTRERIGEIAAGEKNVRQIFYAFLLMRGNPVLLSR